MKALSLAKEASLFIDVTSDGGFISFGVLNEILKSITAKAGKLTHRDTVYIISGPKEWLKVSVFRDTSRNMYEDAKFETLYYRYAYTDTGLEVPYTKD